jgi:TonB family protein
MSFTLAKLPSLLVSILLCSSVIAQDSSDAEMYFNRGEANLQSNQYNAAIKEFQQAIRMKPKWPEAYFKLGVAYSGIPISVGSNGENLKAALKAFEEAVRLKPDWPEALVELGSKYSSFQQYDKAITSLKRAISLKPELAEAHQHLGIAYLYTGHYNDAITTLQEAIRLKPAQPLAHKLLGLANLVVDERDKALEEYKLLQALDPEMAKYLNNAIQNPDKPTFGVASAKLISVPKPDYPAAAKGISGNVTVEVAIDEQGKVTSARAITGPVELRGAAEAAALKARFTPTKLSGTPVSVNGVITFRFVPQ